MLMTIDQIVEELTHYVETNWQDFAGGELYEINPERWLRQKLEQLLMGLEEKFEAKKEALEIEAEWLDTRLMKNDWFEVRYMEAMLALNIKKITDIVKKIAENLAKVAALDEAIAEIKKLRGKE